MMSNSMQLEGRAKALGAQGMEQTLEISDNRAGCECAHGFRVQGWESVCWGVGVSWFLVFLLVSCFLGFLFSWFLDFLVPKDFGFLFSKFQRFLCSGR